MGGGQQPEPGHLALARPLPRRRRRLDPPERADPRPGLGHDQGRAQGALGRAGREPLQPPDRRLRQRHPPRPAPPRLRRDATGSSPRFHAMLETHIRGEQQAAPRQPPGLPAPRDDQRGLEPRDRQVHRQLPRDPRQGRRAVRLEVELDANSGSMLNGQDDKHRVINYEYTLVYGLDGKVDETNPHAADWISVGGEAMFAPLNILEVVESRWAGHNPYVTEANVRALDLANGGGRRPLRLGSAAVPPGRPVRRSPLGGQQSFDVRQRQRQLGPASRRLLPDPLRPLSPRRPAGTRPAPLHPSCVRLPRSSPDPSADQTPRRDRAFSLAPGMAVTRHRWLLGTRSSRRQTAADGRDSAESPPSIFPGFVIFVIAVQVRRVSGR